MDYVNLEDGCISPKGYRATGINTGLKTGGFKDMSLLISDQPCSVAAVFTSNTIRGVHIALDIERLNNPIRAIIANSGNANCLTGEEGVKNARELLTSAEKHLNIPEGQVMMASTGIIGQQLNMTYAGFGIKRLSDVIHTESSIRNFCAGIMTTDTRQQNAACEFELENKLTVRIGCSAKGASMLKPRLELHATLLAFITTDAAITSKLMQKALNEICGRTFNRISIDNDTSPNDSVFFLANGAAGNSIIDSEDDPRYKIFYDALEYILEKSAKGLIRQGLGVTKLIHLLVRGAPTEAEAEKLVRAVAESYQFKTAMFGRVPSWQKILNVVDYTMDSKYLKTVEIRFNDLCLYANEQVFSQAVVSAHAEMNNPECTITLDLHSGDKQSFLYTCDLSHDYVKVNAHFAE
ncbi:MAG: bifunctional glutamate N-acetyltransferase/amino-acid acetyltransferase ArgJ [Brevinema sp.]